MCVLSGRSLKTRPSEVNFYSVFGERKRVEQKEVQLSHLSLTSLEGKPTSVGWGKKGGAMYAVLP